MRVKLLVLLGVCLLLLVLRPRMREGLAATNDIRAPDVEQVYPGGGGSTRVYGPAEQDRIWALMPQSVRQWAMGSYAIADAATLTRLGKEQVATILAEYYPIYERKTSPVTDADLNTYVVGLSTSDRPPVKAALKAYFVDQPQPPAPESPPPSSMTGGTGSPLPTMPPDAGPVVLPPGPPGPMDIAPSPSPTSFESSSPVVVTVEVGGSRRGPTSRVETRGIPAAV